MATKKRKKLTKKQLKYFGTARQRAALRRRSGSKSVSKTKRRTTRRSTVPKTKNSLLKVVAIVLGTAAAAALAVFTYSQIKKQLGSQGITLTKLVQLATGQPVAAVPAGGSLGAVNPVTGLVPTPGAAPVWTGLIPELKGSIGGLGTWITGAQNGWTTPKSQGTAGIPPALLGPVYGPAIPSYPQLPGGGLPPAGDISYNPYETREELAQEYAQGGMITESGDTLVGSGYNFGQVW